MKDENKTKKQLIKELEDLRKRIGDLNKLEKKQKKTEEILQASEVKFRTLAEKSPQMIFINKKGRVVYVNKECERKMGYKLEEFYAPGFNFLNLIAPESLDLIKANFSKHLKGKDVPPYEYTLITKGGKRIEAIIASKLIPYGEETSILGVVTDITERKKIEDTLRTSEEKFSKAFRNNPDSLYITTIPEGKFVDVNPVFEKISGYNKDEVLGKTVLDLDFYINPDDRDKLFKRLQKDGRLHDYEISYRIKSGEILLCRVFSEVIDIQGKTHLLSIVRDITERKKAEDELRSSEERLKILFEYAPDAYYLSDLKGNFIDGNRIAEELTGYKRKELIGKSFLKLKLLSSKQALKAAALLKKNALGKATGPDEFTFTRKNGTQVIVEIRTYPVKIKGQTQVLGIARDFTEHKQSEKALQESEEQFRDLVEKSGIAIVIDDIEGNFRYFNDKFASLFGYTPEEMEKISPPEFIHPDDLGRNMEFHKKRIQGENPPSRYEFRGIKKDGSFIHLEIDVVSFKDNGKITGTRSYLWDITEHKNTEEALRESEDKYRGIFESLHDVYYRTDREGNVTIISPSVRSQAGYNPEDIIGHQVTDFYLNPSDREFFKTKLKESGVINDYELKLLAKGGRVIDVSISSQIIFGSNGEPVGVEGVLRDITERKRAEEALKESLQTSDDIIRSIPAGIFIYKYDPPDRLILMGGNPEAARLTRIKPDEWQGKEFNEIFPEAKERGITDSFLEVMRTGKTSEMEDLYYKDERIEGASRTHAFRISGERLVVSFENITERKRAAEKLKESYKKLQKAISGNIQLMATTVEIRDPYTAGHQRRVADLARAIATEMALSKDQIEGIYMAGVIHDLGKVSVPSEILSKPSRLTEMEFSLIKTHPQVGFDILREIEFPWPIAQIVYQHHERMDGFGYPQGLSGEKILLEARIMCVADVVEAMASHRPYRPALGIDVALGEIKKNRGKLYDPDVADACLTLFAENKFKFTD